MIKNTLKKIPGFSFAKNLAEKRKFKKELKEVYKRAETNTFMIDCSEEEKANWRKRTDDVLASSDLEKIEYAPNAGTLEGDYFLMHNGLIILPLSYYGWPVLQMLHETRGVHEPQEEYVFQEVIKEMKEGASMLELGAYWSFYSMWFNKDVKSAKNYMIEPWEIDHGIKNFKLNELKGEFFQFYISDNPGTHADGSQIITVDSFVSDQKIKFLDILHSDIQGSELEMLHGAENLLTNRKVGYVFVSTHSNELHRDCADVLEKHGFLQICSANLDETFSYDGLLVYRNPDYPGMGKLEISLKKS